MPARPLVSVVIATYNRAHVLCEAIGSVLAQTYRSFEVIVVDDGSTDGTDAVLTKYGDRIKAVRRRTNGGQSAAQNDGIRHSIGDLLCFLDDDDLYLPNRLQVAVDFLECHPEYGAVYTEMLLELARNGPRARWISRPGPLPSGRIFEALLRTDPYWLSNTPSITVRRGVMEAVGGFDESLTFGQDAELWWRVSRATLIGYVAEPTCVFRCTPPTSSARSRISAGHLACSRKVLDSYTGLTARERRAALSLHCSDLRVHGCYLAAEGRRADAFRFWHAALKDAMGAGLAASAVKTIIACALGGSAQTVAHRARTFRAKCVSGVSGLLQKAGGHG